MRPGDVRHRAAPAPPWCLRTGLREPIVLWVDTKFVHEHNGSRGGMCARLRSHGGRFSGKPAAATKARRGRPRAERCSAENRGRTKVRSPLSPRAWQKSTSPAPQPLKRVEHKALAGGPAAVFACGGGVAGAAGNGVRAGQGRPESREYRPRMVVPTSPTEASVKWVGLGLRLTLRRRAASLSKCNRNRIFDLRRLLCLVSRF